MRTEEAEERADVVAEAMTWLRTPHEHGQCVKGAGVDCGRFLIAVFQACDVVPPIEPGAYPYDYHLHRNEERYLPLVESVAHRIHDEPKPGDIALFKFGRVISHGAIMLEPPDFIHTHVYQGVVLDSLEANATFRERLMGYWSVWPRE